MTNVDHFRNTTNQLKLVVGQISRVGCTPEVNDELGLVKFVDLNLGPFDFLLLEKAQNRSAKDPINPGWLGWHTKKLHSEEVGLFQSQRNGEHDPVQVMKRVIADIEKVRMKMSELGYDVSYGDHSADVYYGMVNLRRPEDVCAKIQQMTEAFRNYGKGIWTLFYDPMVTNEEAFGLG